MGTIQPNLSGTKAADRVGGADRNMDFVKQMQQQALVLLKNENNILPLDKRQIKKVLVTGPLADEDNFMTSRYGPKRPSTLPTPSTPPWATGWWAPR